MTDFVIGSNQSPLIWMIHESIPRVSDDGSASEFTKSGNLSRFFQMVLAIYQHVDFVRFSRCDSIETTIIFLLGEV